MTTSSSLTHVSNEDLLAEVKRLAGRERQATAALIAALMELDARRLYLGEGCSSLFTYCTQVLHLSEHAAYGRITAARAARQFPLILDLLIDGSLTLTTVAAGAAPHVRKSPRASRRVALRPQPAVPSSVRKLPTLKAPEASPPQREDSAPQSGAQAFALDSSAPASHRPAAVQPLAPERYKIQVTIGREAYEKLRRMQDLLRHSIPNGDPAAIFDRALTVLLAKLERRKLAATDHPRAARATARRSRNIPAAVRRAVWARDSGRCAFIGTNGRCTEAGLLEFHHVRPYAAGGEARVENLELRCAAHNTYEVERYFGPRQPMLVCEGSGYLYSGAPLGPDPAVGVWAISDYGLGPCLTDRWRSSVVYCRAYGDRFG